MPKYEVEIIETFSRIVEVEAANMLEAENIVEKLWLDNAIVLDYDDFVDATFDAQREIEQ